MTRDTQGQTHAKTATESQLPNQITIVGRGVPSSFELAVAGDLEMVADEPVEEAIIVSGGVAEGTIDVGVQQFRFSGELANIRVVDWNGVEAPESSNTPTIHVQYGGLE